jgi:putative phosphoribosyl transferase
MPRFRDRRDAGRRLAERLDFVRGEDALVLGVPRGGVVVAHEIATQIGAPLDVVVVRKLGYPGHEEAGFGALGEDDVLVPEELGGLRADDPRQAEFRSVIEVQQKEVAERVERYRGGRPPQPLEGRTAVVADDGVATGYTYAAALAIARKRSPKRLIAAAPAASWEGAQLITPYCDELVAIGTADRGLFFAVSLYYDEFPQVSDEEVVELLNPNPP